MNRFSKDQLHDFYCGRFPIESELRREMCESLRDEPDGQIARYFAEERRVLNQVLNPDWDRITEQIGQN